MLTWVDEHVQPAGSLLAQRPSTRLAPRPDEGLPMSSAPDSPGAASGPEPSGLSMESGGRSAVPVRGNAATGGAQPVDDPDAPPVVTDRLGALPADGTTQPQVIAPR
jgi:hypothetical protein